MKILIISSVFPPGFIGGFELIACELATTLKRRGYDIFVLTSDYFLDYNLEINDFPVSRSLEYISPFTLDNPEDIVNKGVYLNFRNIRMINEALVHFQPEAVLIFDCRGLGTLGLLKYIIQIGYKPILNMGDDIFKAINESPNEKAKFCSIFGTLEFLLHSKSIIVSHSLAKQVNLSLGFKLTDQKILPRWYTKTWSAGQEQEAKNYQGPSRFIFAARLDHVKGIYILIDAVKVLLKQNPHFVVDLYGGGNISEVTNYININGLQDHIQYQKLIPKEQLPDILINYDFLIFPTHEHEPIGGIVSEAAAVGCIPIMTVGIGSGEWFINGFNCIKILRNVEALTTALIKCLQMNPQERWEMKRRAVEAARIFFDFEKNFLETESIIQEAVLEQKKLHCPINAQSAMLVLKEIWRGCHQ